MRTTSIFKLIAYLIPNTMKICEQMFAYSFKLLCSKWKLVRTLSFLVSPAGCQVTSRCHPANSNRDQCSELQHPSQLQSRYSQLKTKSMLFGHTDPSLAHGPWHRYTSVSIAAMVSGWQRRIAPSQRKPASLEHSDAQPLRWVMCALLTTTRI